MDTNLPTGTALQRSICAAIAIAITAFTLQSVVSAAPTPYRGVESGLLATAPAPRAGVVSRVGHIADSFTVVLVR
jgi:hypothetical protein